MADTGVMGMRSDRARFVILVQTSDTACLAPACVTNRPMVWGSALCVRTCHYVAAQVGLALHSPSGVRAHVGVRGLSLIHI